MAYSATQLALYFVVIVLVVVAAALFRVASRGFGRGRFGGDASLGDSMLGGDSFDDEALGGGDSQDEDDGVDGGASGSRPFRLGVRDPGYTELFEGKRTVEARLARGPFGADAHHPVAAGDPIVVARSRPAGDTSEYTKHPRRYETTVKRVTRYKTFAELLAAEKKAAHFADEKSAMKALREFYPDDEKEFGVVAIELVPHKH